jgi:ABC-type amino acid transport substrate-binding protein
MLLIFKCVVIALFLFSGSSLISEEKKTYKCGIVVGFPPYQFIDRKGKTAGIDYDITKALFEEAGFSVVFVQSSWDDVMFCLAHKTGKIDFICGAEISDVRTEMFDFSDECYIRTIQIFVLKKSDIMSIDDLNGKIISGDRHSYYEKYLTEGKLNIRLMQTRNKEESFTKLKNEVVSAVIAPLEVGNYVSRNLGISVRVLEDKNLGTPVAFAVAKGDYALLKIINKSLKVLIKEKKIEKIKAKYSD